MIYFYEELLSFVIYELLNHELDNEMTYGCMNYQEKIMQFIRLKGGVEFNVEIDELLV